MQDYKQISTPTSYQL